ncbi:phosphotransferase system lactose/cellobiose-specific IIB subunit [Coriobacterium glomerans PW2]|uniref:Phosphotransferase system lactose/cellobiose-specific IIB subunit n=1 Tax=Coriobacterium glomerans (strain ATCC 49209 / DSM 20642 / JCM 10262 / PW2) TaxID=700015 RepID=F2NAT7_CORGP|nr:PTS sugar transporter subunit IIB [Coriobacterium glomerans]AEB07615.1 phosphotransferase system lactose/cellobiose-specific IIB subunit [Coriobacterium glomerans PW2]
MKICAVCAFGVGSSIIAKMNIEAILADEGREEIEVITVDLGSISGTDADIYVTTNELSENFPEEFKDKTVVLDNFIDRASIQQSLDPRIAALGA